MIVDTSAIVAIFLREPDYEEIYRKIANTPQVAIGAPTLVECGLVLSNRLSTDARPLLSRFLSTANITVVAFSEAHYLAATGAYLKYGKGRHPAKLNFGDCLTYAVAKLAQMPLLFVGNDFTQTDLPPA